MQSKIVLHFSFGVKGLHSLSLNYLRHIIAFLSFSFYDPDTIDKVWLPMLTAEIKIIIKIKPDAKFQFP